MKTQQKDWNIELKTVPMENKKTKRWTIEKRRSKYQRINPGSSTPNRKTFQKMTAEKVMGGNHRTKNIYMRQFFRTEGHKPSN